MPKKGESQGSVYYEKRRKKWISQYYDIDIKTGKSIRKSKSFALEQEAKDYLDSIMYQKGNPLYIKNNGIPLNELMRANAQRKFDANLISENQFGRIIKTIELIETSALSHKKIDELTTDEIQNYFTKVKHYSNSYIKKIFEQYNQAFKYAMDNGYITRNPMNLVIKPKSDKKNKVVRALTIEEQKSFVDLLLENSNIYRNAYLIQMFMGLRIGEVLALSNYDINLKDNIIIIDKTLTTDKDGKVIMGDSAKTYAGNRELPIPKFLRPYIIEQMEIAENTPKKMLFLSPNGKYVDSRNVNRYLKKLLKDNFGITDISTHSLRHTYGTRCVEAGMSAVALQRLMGHNDVSTTLNTYASVFNKYKKDEIEKVNNYYLHNNLILDESSQLKPTKESNNLYFEDELKYNIQENINKLNEFMFSNSNKKIVLLTDIFNKSIAFVSKDKETDYIDNAIPFETWEEIKAFIKGIEICFKNTLENIQVEEIER